MTISEWNQLKALVQGAGGKVSEVYHHRGDPSKPHLLRVGVEKFNADIAIAPDPIEQVVKPRRVRK